ncbi:MAG: symmetrical bis(5'-nucleosyl)-tetraphosphatase [bacterium]
MATFAVGDVQGCLREFEILLERINFSSQDRLWLVGDLINRGPHSLEVLRLVHGMHAQVKVVLGNHELHFLAIYLGGHKPGSSDTFDDLLGAADAEQLADWLCQQKILHHDPLLNCTMTHAGIPHIWNLDDARGFAREVEDVLLDKNDEVSARAFFAGLYGNEPNCWQAELAGLPRYRLLANYFTRMRLVNSAGCLDFSHKGVIADAPPGWVPWFTLVARQTDEVRPMKLLFGHWAALEGQTHRDDMIALDTGCVWGRHLTACCLETGEFTTVDALD